MIIYGSILCEDCVMCREDLDMAGVPYEYRDICKNLKYLKEFLAIRDKYSLFDGVKADGRIGIPCIVLPDGYITLDWNEVI